MTNWLKNFVAVKVKPNSMRTYQTLFKKQILPCIGAVKVQELTPAMFDKWISDLQKRGLSYNSLAALHSFVHHALDYAVYPAQCR